MLQTKRIYTLLLCLMATFILGSVAAGRVYYVVPGGLGSGDSWTDAKGSIQAAIDSAASGDEIWVKSGIYTGRITLKVGRKLLGSFTGSDDTRNLTNPSVIDANFPAGYRAVTVQSGATSSTVIDGFKITRGYGGIYCSSASPTITRNTITGNKNGYESAGIYISNGSPVITDNRFIRNEGVAVYIGSYASPTFTRNVIQDNWGIGIQCSSVPRIANNLIASNGEYGVRDDYGATYVNNTVTDHTRGGVICYSSTAKLANNIVAYNNAFEVSGTPTFRHNCVYNPVQSKEYSPSANHTTDRNHEEPGFVNRELGRFYLASGSPCIDTGSDGAVQGSDTTYEGHDRTVDGDGDSVEQVDIGADEYDTVYPHSSDYTVIYVDYENGDDQVNDGSSWTSAKQTVQAGIDKAAETGGEVYVKEGKYSERVAIPSYVYLYGGWGSDGQGDVERDTKEHHSIIDGGMLGFTVTMYGGFRTSKLDGLVIQNGLGGVSCRSTSPTISNNRIVCNDGNLGGGIYCYWSSALITRNVISGNTAARGAGIYLNGLSATITNNLILSNCAGQKGGGATYDNKGGGIYDSSSAATTYILNNTIVSNSAPDGGGVFSNTAHSVYANNIIAYNSSGFINTGTAVPTLFSNCVWNPPVRGAARDYGTYNPNGYSGFLDIDNTNDILADPHLAGIDAGDVHLTSASTACIDAANSSYTAGIDVDFEGDARSGAVDIGADEQGSYTNTYGTIFYVDGARPDDNGDGRSWTTAKKSIQAAIDAARLVGGGKVWVKAHSVVDLPDDPPGVLHDNLPDEPCYRENITVPAYVYLYGGFDRLSGTPTWEERDPEAYPTVIHSLVTETTPRSVVSFFAGYHTSGIDGFTICHGPGTIFNSLNQRTGGGIYSWKSSPIISSSIIEKNTVDRYGGGMTLGGEWPKIIGNRVRNNTSVNDPGGVSCGCGIVSNNIISNNTRAGVMCGTDTIITNNTIANNTGDGVNCCYYQAHPDGLYLRNNIISGNGGYGVNDGNETWTDENNVIWSRNSHYNGFFGNPSGAYSESGYTGTSEIIQSSSFSFIADWHIPSGAWVGGGDNAALGLPDADLDGGPRVLPATSGVVDMGADEFDSSPPDTPLVSDEGECTASHSTLGASWASADAEGGIVKYQYAIGTTQGGTDTVSWTDEIGACITRSGLALSDNTDYYFAVKATNTSGVESAAGTSDGITVVSFSNGWDDSTNTITTSAVNGTSCVYTFDERYRLRRVEYKDSGGVLIPGAAVYYAVNSVGNRTEMWFDDFLSTSGRTLYDYDFAGRLTSVTYPGQNALTYTLDWVGNRISGGWQYDDADRLVGPGSYTYSGSGNLLTSPSPAPTYTYDDKDLLSVVE